MLTESVEKVIIMFVLYKLLGEMTVEYCLNCFQALEGEKICPACGFKENVKERLPQYLEANAVIKQRYRIGRIVGQGGFGITYKAYDQELQRIVAIKEYYPAEIVQRIQGRNTVSPYRQSEMPGQFQHGKEKFLEEARTLAKFSDFPGIVRLYDCFEENGTAYIVMQFLEGIDLAAYLEGKGGRISCEEAKQILLPVVDALKEVHRTGMIHRDISPQNIFITTAGQIKVIDFGAARAAMLGEEKSRSILLKPGYAPEEQYRTHGNQGPWTDVYALTATLYRMVTGLLPPDALERLHGGEELQLPEELSPEVRFVIQKGMAIRAGDRFMDMAALQAALYADDSVDFSNVGSTKMQREENERWGDNFSGASLRPMSSGNGSIPNYEVPTAFSSGQKQKKKGNLAVVLIVTASVLLIISMIAFMFYMLLNGEPEETGEETIQTQNSRMEEETYMPPEFSMITASNKTTSSQSGRSYGAALAFDGRTDTAWNVPGGVGEWIQLSADAQQKIKGIKILNGYTKYSPDYKMWIYYANSRPKDITITFSDGTYLTYRLQDVFQEGNYNYQTVDFGGIKQTAFVRITINSVYKGNKWNDCCISEIQPY